MSNLNLSVLYNSPETDAVQLEVDLYGEPILFGTWDVAVRFRGRTLRPEGEWTEVCTHRENSCDFLELDLPLSRNFRLQRFFLLDEKDRVLILADTVLRDGAPTKSDADTELEYESTLLYAPELRPESRHDATELLFRRRKAERGRQGRPRPVFRVLPICLPEWKTAALSGPIRGSLDLEHDAMVLRRQAAGRALFAPLFFDLDAERLKKPYTWRHLTVGENLEKVPPDQAAGYRVQLGDEQFLLYHSMTPPANRTVLGHNLVDDLCFARFDPASGVEPLVEVQQED